MVKILKFIVIFFAISINLAISRRCSPIKSLKEWYDYSIINVTIARNFTARPALFNFTLDIRRDLPSVIINFDLSFKRETHTSQFINKTFDLCKLFEGRNFDMLSNAFLGPAFASVGMPNSCPIKKGLYCKHNFQLGDRRFMYALPKGELYAKFRISTLICGIFTSFHNKMLATLGSVKPFFRLKPKFISIDNFAFKLHYRWSFGIFLVCTVLVTSRQYIGEHINCINDAIPNHVINTFCFFTTTFTVVRHMNDSSLAVGDASYPGVGPKHYQEDPVKHHAYYQWVPFVLLLQALLFYMPHLIWKSLEGGRIRYLVDGLHMIGASKQARVKEGIQSSGRTILTADELDGRIKRIKTTYLNRLYLNKFWGFYLVGCECLNLMVITMQWSFTNWFLAGQFYSLGGRILHENWLGRMDVLDVVFPKMTKCHFRKFGPSGSLQLHDALCLMGLNIINEKIFTFMWFWFLFLWMVSLFAILWRFIVLLLHRSTTFNSILLPFICLARLNRGDVENVFRKISFSNWIFLYHLAGNLESIIFRDVMSELSTELGNTQNEEGENFNNHQVEDNDERENDSDENKTAFDTVDSEAKKK